MSINHLLIDGMRVAVRQSGGEGPAALLIHGNSASSVAFRQQIDSPLGARFRLAAIDLPGHGASDNAPDPAATYSLPGYAAVVAEAARQLGIADGVLVGWSLGGHIALEASRLLPELAGLMIFGTPPLAYPPDMAAAFLPDPAMGILFQEALSDDEVAVRVAGMLREGAPLPPEFIADVRRSDGSFRSHLLNSIGTVGFADEVQLVAGLKIPLAIIHGGRERVVSGDYISALAMPTLWRGAVQTIAEAGHTPPWETPAAFDALLADFLSDSAR
jgi:pimeloyl-ACP methyl ester carboxylesterase